MLDYVYLQKFDLLLQKYFRKSYLCTTMRQTRLSRIAIIEISNANRILQVSMDKIIDIFGKRKNRESFLCKDTMKAYFCHRRTLL